MERGNGGGAGDDVALKDAVAGDAGGADTKRVPRDPLVSSLAHFKWTTEAMTSLTGSDFGCGPSCSRDRLLRRFPYCLYCQGLQFEQAAYTPNQLSSLYGLPPLFLLYFGAMSPRKSAWKAQ